MTLILVWWWSVLTANPEPSLTSLTLSCWGWRNLLGNFIDAYKKSATPTEKRS